MSHQPHRFDHYQVVRQLGPGLITGAADDDPSGIATYSQAGAQFGFNMLWTMVFTYPLMVGIQLVSARTRSANWVLRSKRATASAEKLESFGQSLNTAVTR